MVPLRSDRVSRAPPYSRMHRYLRYGAITRYGRPFQTCSAYPNTPLACSTFRSPLLAESLLMSFPPGTEMFQFPGFASPAYVFSGRYPKGVGCPFGYPRIKACSRLPMAFRSVATSFIASWCQGIHRIALLILHTRNAPLGTGHCTNHAQEPTSASTWPLAFNHPPFADR